MQIVTIKLSQISGLHPAASEILSATANLIYASGPSDVNEEAIKLLADIHPVHVVPRGEKYQVVAGFRIYELCMRISVCPATCSGFIRPGVSV